MKEGCNSHEKGRRNSFRMGKKGVSEVLAQLMILTITVVLFSTIFLWVHALPPAQGYPKTELRGGMEIKGVSPYTYYINLTHINGEPLEYNSTVIYVSVVADGSSYVLNIRNGTTKYLLQPGDVWSWTLSKTFISNVSVKIVNPIKNYVVWQALLTGYIPDEAPSIVERGTTPDPVVIEHEFKVWAIVRDADLNYNSVYVNLSSIDPVRFPQPIKMNNTVGWRFETANLSLNENMEPGKFTVMLWAVDMKGHNTTALLTINIVSGEGMPKLVVEMIELSNGSPTRGEKVTINAIIKNMGKRAAESSVITFIDYSDLHPSGIEIGNLTNFSVSGYGQNMAFIDWVASPGGLHKIEVTITYVMPGNLTGTPGNITVVVNPKVLLVDDDAAIAGSSDDCVSNISAALTASNIKFDVVLVAAGADGPKYDSGDKQLKDYDVVIWVGGRANYTLTTNDQNNLSRFMNNGGRAWLVGQNILEGANSLYTMLGISSVSTIPLPASLRGADPGTGWINTSSLTPALVSASPFNIARKLTLGSAKTLFTDYGVTNIVSSQYKAGAYRVVAMPHEFGRIRDTGDQAVIAYKIVNWLGGINNRTGEDLAVSGQVISPLNPRYNQPVNITVTVRNNGETRQTTEVGLIINGKFESTLVQMVTLDPNGDSKTLPPFSWTPPGVGNYVIKAMIDPKNQIEETNEENNVYVSEMGVFEIEVIYTVLVVDDDSSNTSGYLDVGANVVRSLTQIGYTVGYDLDIDWVPIGQSRNQTKYPLRNYNTVIWVTGTTTGTAPANTLTAVDITDIKNYLTSAPTQVSFLLIGRSVLSDTNVPADFKRDYLGADITAGSSIQMSVVYGVRESPITNGIAFQMDNASFSGNYLARSYRNTANAIPLFWADASNYWYRTSDLVVGSALRDVSGWHSAYLAFDLAYTTNISAAADFLYGVIHWFGKLENKPELRVTPPDMFAGTNTRQYIILPELNPQLGESYVLKANITNWGGQDADVIVRFLDGDTVIGSQNVHVPASYRDAFGQTQNGKVTAEVIWTPLFAGFEPIRVNVDPENLLAGIEALRPNNLAEQRIEVYYFYDDLEEPSRVLRNWKHESTIVRINGEAPLEYLDPGSDVNVNIARYWDGWDKSTTKLHGFSLTNTTYHSYPNCYGMKEPAGEVPFIYEFYLPIDAWDNTGFGQGFYFVGVNKTSNYTLWRFDRATPKWDRIDTNTINAGQIRLYETQTPETVYRVVSNGPMLIVVTSSEGSNVNCANWVDGLGRGRNFVVMGDIRNRLGGETHVVAINPYGGTTTVTVEWVNYANGAVIETDTLTLAGAGSWQEARLNANHYTAYARVTATNDIILYRLSNDNDEIDNAMGVGGTSLDTTLYCVTYRSVSSWPWRFYIANPGSTAATVTVQEIAGGSWSDTCTVNPTSFYILSRNSPPSDGNLHVFRITSTQPVRVIFGQDQFGGTSFNTDFFGAYQTNFGVDSVVQYVPSNEIPGQYTISSPTVYATSGSSVSIQYCYQHFSFGKGDSVTINPSLPILGVTSNANIPSNSIDYVATFNFTLSYTTIGTISNIQYRIDGGAWQTVGGGAISLPWGAHTVSFQASVSINGYFGINGISFSEGGSIVWQLNNVADNPATAINERTTHFGDNNYAWQYTANNRFLYIFGGGGNCWIHTILPFEGATLAGGGGGAGISPMAYNPVKPNAVVISQPKDTEGCNYTQTPAFTLSSEMESVHISFYHKFSLVPFFNGGVIMVGTSDSNWKYEYIEPTKPYPTNTLLFMFQDAYGHWMNWVYSGNSGGNTGDWEFGEVNLTKYIPASGTRQIKVAFQYLFGGAGLNGYWYIDDVTVKITRKNSANAAGVADQWQYIQDANRAHRGSGVWWNGNPSTGYLSGGIDNALITRPIDLTNAKNATLAAYFRFNVNWGVGGAGRPPDGFRVEVSADNGVTWQPICLGVRSGWNVSGWENSPDLDPIRPGIQTYTGVTETGDKAYWVPASSLYRLNVDLSGWRGSVVLLRFRVVTNSTLPNHYAQPISTVGFGGLYIDDIKVFGETIIHGMQAYVTKELVPEITEEKEKHVCSEAIVETQNPSTNCENAPIDCMVNSDTRCESTNLNYLSIFAQFTVFVAVWNVTVKVLRPTKSKGGDKNEE
ncbi:MAG: CARDB domain-containing protein [Thermoplasmata archaeon]